MGKPFRILTVVDNWSRESPVLEVGFRLTGSSVVEALSGVGKTVCLPASITVDHGTEFTSRALDFWARGAVADDEWKQVIFCSGPNQ